MVLLSAAQAFAVTRPTYGGGLRIAFSEPLAALGPARARSFADWTAVSLIHAGLYRFGSDGEATVDLLAEPPRSLKRGRVWRCRLRPARYHDGRRVRADHVRRSMAALAAGPWAWWPALASVRVRSDYEFDLVFSQTQKLSELAQTLASPALSIWPGGDGRVGAGPFAAVAWSPAEQALVLAAAERHHRGRPYLDGLTLAGGLGVDGVVERFHYQKADLVFEGSDRYRGATTLPGPIVETLGLAVRPTAPAKELARRKAVARHVPRKAVSRLFGGKQAQRVTPGGATPRAQGSRHPAAFRWFIGVPEPYRELGRAVATGLGPAGSPWPTQPLDRWTLASALKSRASGQWDALLISAAPPAGRRLDAERTILRLVGATSADDLLWIPLSERARQGFYRGALNGVRWGPTGLLVLDDTWRPSP